MPANPYFAQTDDEREMLRMFRAMTAEQQRAMLVMLKAMVGFKVAMEGADHG